MTLEVLNAKVREWDLQNNGSAVADSKYGLILDQLTYHARKEWRVYLPAEHPDLNSNYLERLAAWIGNVANESDQKLLLEYALFISFFSHEDFAALYRTALVREVARWVAEQVGARLDPLGGQAFHNLVNREIHNHTWFCPVTDSMDINEFYKVNHLKGVGHRPGFSTLQMLAEGGGAPDPMIAAKLIQYMAKPPWPLKRLVLLEDVVGSASQCSAALRWAAQSLGKPVLFVPLILCPNGIDALRAEEVLSNGQLTVRPVIELRRGELLGPERQGHQGWEITPQMESLALRFAGRASVNMDTFGYRSTGCSLVTFSNSPDNTLPIVHHKPQGGGWEPLFPRIYRD